VIPRWTGRVELIPSKLDEPLRWRKPRRIFVNSMSDLFHEKLSDEAIAAVFGVMAACPQHTFQVLTKRPERMRRWFEWVGGHEGPHSAATLCAMFAGRNIGASRTGGTASRWPLSNVWLGVSVEDQTTADERIPLLLQTPAALRFVSYEPALGPVDFSSHLRRSRNFHVSMSVEGAIRNRSYGCLTDDTGRALSRMEAETELLRLHASGAKLISAGGCSSFSDQTGCPGHDNPRLNWLIVGGESGPGARPFDVAWARSAVAQCKAAGVPVFVKQLGARPHGEPWLKANGRWVQTDNHPALRDAVILADRKGGDPSEWPEDLRIREFPEVK